jgi:PAT family beta-lactamase induction signal transducer AmpG
VTPPPPAPSPPPSAPRGPSAPRYWVASTYFAEGFPYSIVHSLSDVLFKELGASLATIGLTSLFHLPWNLKFLWGPLLDGFGTKRRWLVLTEVALVALTLCLALTSALPSALTIAAVLFTLLAAVAATHDIAIDGYYLEALDPKAQSAYVGFRATAYKLAMLAIGGPTIYLAATAGWPAAFFSAAAVLAGLLAYHHRYLPHAETELRPLSELSRLAFRPRALALLVAIAATILAIRAALATETWTTAHAAAIERYPWLARLDAAGLTSLALLATLLALLALLGPLKRRLARSDSFYASAFVDFLAQPRIHRILAFVVLFRTGESFLLKMRYPFLRDIGMTMEEYSVASGTIGLIASFAGTLLGGWLISRDGLRRWLWPLVLAQNVPNLAFMVVALSAGPGSPTPHIATLTAVIAVEQLGSGLGTAVLMVYLMRCCRPPYKAAHMAIVTALMSVSFTIAGVMSGVLAEALGFPIYFGLSFVAAIPGMLILPFVPYLDGSTAADVARPEPSPNG